MASGSIKGLTLEIGGNTTKLTNALKEPEKASKELKASLNDVNKALKFDSSNVELLSNKQKILTQTISSTEDELKILKDAQQQYIDSGGDLNSAEYINLSTRIQDTENYLKRLKESQSNFNAEVESMGIKLGEFGDKATSTGTSLTKAVTAPVAAIGTAAVTTAANFESSMSQVQATMGITKDATTELNGQTVNTMDSLESLAQTMGETTAFSASECADAINYLALAGYDTQQMYDTLPTVLNLAAAGSMDLATASDMVTDAMSALGMGTDEATTMVDQMAKTASSSNTSVAELGDAILTIGGTAKTVAGGTAELNTALGILANNGVKGSEGGTHLRNVIMSLQSPTDTAAKMINSLGLEVYDAQGEMRPLNDILGDLNSTMDGMTTEEKQNIISTIFNKTDIASVNALLANTGDTWDELQATITDSSGAAQQMADTQLDNLQGQLTLLQSAVEGLAISIGNIILPAIKNFVTYVQKAVDWLNSLSDGTKTAVVAIAAIAASIGPALVAIGKMSTGMSKVIKFFNSGATIGGKLVASFASITGSAGLAVVAIGAIVAAIAAVVGAFVNLWNNNQEFHDNIIGIWNSIKETWESFTSGITERLNTLGFSFEDFSEVVSAVWNGFCEVLAPVFEGAFSVVADVFTTITNTILDIWDIFSALFQGDWDGVWQGVQTLFGDVWQGICDLFSDCWDTIKGVADTILGFFGTDWDSCFQTVSETWNSIWQGISDFFNGIIEGIKAIASPFVDWFKSIFGDGNDEIETDNAETWTTVKTDTSTALSDIKSDSSKKWSDISSDLSDSLSKIKQNVSDKWSEIKEKTSDTFTTIKEKISDKWSDIKSNTSDKISSIKENISSKWSDIKSSTSDTFSTIKSNTGSTLSKMVSSFASNFSSMKSTTSTQMSGIQSSSSSGMSGTYQVVCNQLTNIKAQFVSVWNACVSTVSSAVSRLKGLMNFSWSLPHIKVPHFSLSGSFDLKKMTVPTISVSWYAKAMKDAMIFNQPTIFGYNSATGAFMGAGEAGSETLVGTQTLMNMISVASQSGIDRTTSAVNDMYDWMANGGLVDQMVNAVENRLMIKLNEREVGRVVKRNV